MPLNKPIEPHSIDRHPLRCFEDFAKISNDVQFGRISWPICMEIVREEKPEEKTVATE